MPWSELYYHFVWATLHRAHSITEVVRGPLYSAINIKTTELKGSVLALNGMADHLHLVVSLPPSISLSVFIGAVKGRSAHVVNHTPDLDLLEKFRWQDDFWVLSITTKDLPRVIRYVEEQQNHHATQEFQRAFERTYEYHPPS